MQVFDSPQTSSANVAPGPKFTPDADAPIAPGEITARISDLRNAVMFMDSTLVKLAERLVLVTRPYAPLADGGPQESPGALTEHGQALQGLVETVQALTRYAEDLTDRVEV